jgi:hypothetical protein
MTNAPDPRDLLFLMLIHLIFAAQRPDANVMPVELRDNLGNRLILKAASVGTSEIALGMKGAEVLLGQPNSGPHRNPSGTVEVDPHGLGEGGDPAWRLADMHTIDGAPVETHQSNDARAIATENKGVTFGRA